MNTLPTKKRIFSDVTQVSRGAALLLNASGLINKQNVVVSWTYLSPFLRDRMLDDKEAKALILLELFRDDGQPTRDDIVERLVCYISTIDKEATREKIAKLKSK